MSRTLAERIKEVRERAGLTGVAFAKELKVTPAYISSLENGKRTNPSDHFLEMVCRKFGVSFGWLKNGSSAIRLNVRDSVIGDVWMLMDKDLIKVQQYIKALKEGKGDDAGPPSEGSDDPPTPTRLVH